MKRFLALLLVLCMTCAVALADSWQGTAEALVMQLAQAGYPFEQLDVENASRVTFDGGALEVFATTKECMAAEEALTSEEGEGYRRGNVLLIRGGLQLTSQYSAALKALLAGKNVPAYDERIAQREQEASFSVWMPIYGGEKYHQKEDCSNMVTPRYVPVQAALFLGFTPCGRCHPASP